VLVLYLFLFEVVRAVWRELTPPARRSRATRAQPNLEIVHAAAAGLIPGDVIVLREVTTIGREQGNDLVVDEDTVSSHHARLVSRDGGWWIEDLGSTNGTTVNDAQVDGTRVLRTGDIIQMGRVQLRFSS
jgi:pSer/pThr/pTyr-binding forkhead associated (FHA) protein